MSGEKDNDSVVGAQFVRKSVEGCKNVMLGRPFVVQLSYNIAFCFQQLCNGLRIPAGIGEVLPALRGGVIAYTHNDCIAVLKRGRAKKGRSQSGQYDAIKQLGAH